MLTQMLGESVARSLPALKSVTTAVALAGLLLGASTANASSLALSGTACKVTSVGGATACAGIFGGNDSNQDLNGLFSVDNWTEILKLNSNGDTETANGITLTVNSSSKTWSVDTYAGNDPVMFVLKGGPTFSAFLMDTSVLSGSWDNLSMLKGNGNTDAGLSHWTIYSGGTTVVPLPAAAWLFGSALLGVVGLGYRRKRTAC